MAKSYWTLPPKKPTPPTIVKIREDETEAPNPEQRAKQSKLEARAKLPKLCKGYKKYNGIMPPKCCGGEGCQVCWLIYEVKNDIK